jgi:predicted nucleic acid-binding Zn finger protein
MTDLFTRLSGKKEIDPVTREEIRLTYGTRGIKALAALDEGRVKKYLDFFVVQGATSEYIIDEDFCTCGDFLYRGRGCWHLLTVRLARTTGLFEPVGLWYQDRWKTQR